MDTNYRDPIMIDSSPEPEPPEYRCRIVGHTAAINSNSVGRQPRVEERSWPIGTQATRGTEKPSFSLQPSSPASQEIKSMKPTPLGSGSVPIHQIFRSVSESTHILSGDIAHQVSSIPNTHARDSPSLVSIGSRLGMHPPPPIDFDMARWHPTEGIQIINKLPPGSILNTPPAEPDRYSVGHDRAPTTNDNEKKGYEGGKIGDNGDRSENSSTNSNTSFPHPFAQRPSGTEGPPTHIQTQSSLGPGLLPPILQLNQFQVNGLTTLSQQQHAFQPLIAQVQQPGPGETAGIVMRAQGPSAAQSTTFPGGPPPTGPKFMEAKSCDHELPYKIIHLLVCTVQKILEEALFDFAKKWVPKLLEKEGWETPEQGELNIWTKVLALYTGDVNFAFRASSVSESFQDLKQMLGRLHHLRHAAVHRNPVGTSWLRQWLIDAVDMSQCLAMCLQEPYKYNKLRIIELGLWQPHKVNLEEVAIKPLDQFKGFDIPDRNGFLDHAFIAEVRRSAALGPTTAGSRFAGGHRARRGRESATGIPQPVIGSDRAGDKVGGVPIAAFMPARMNSKRPRSPSPAQATGRRASKRLKAMLANSTPAKITIDLTKDDQVQQKSLSTMTTLTTVSKVVIDLTED